MKKTVYTLLSPGKQKHVGEVMTYENNGTWVVTSIKSVVSKINGDILITFVIERSV